MRQRREAPGASRSVSFVAGGLSRRGRGLGCAGQNERASGAWRLSRCCSTDRGWRFVAHGRPTDARISPALHGGTERAMVVAIRQPRRRLLCLHGVETSNGGGAGGVGGRDVRQLAVLGASDVQDGQLVPRAGDGRRDHDSRKRQSERQQPSRCSHRSQGAVISRTRSHLWLIFEYGSHHQMSRRCQRKCRSAQRLLAHELLTAVDVLGRAGEGRVAHDVNRERGHVRRVRRRAGWEGWRELVGKTVVGIGGSAGIGFETARRAGYAAHRRVPSMWSAPSLAASSGVFPCSRATT